MFHNIFTSTSRSPKLSLPSRFSYLNSVRSHERVPSSCPCSTSRNTYDGYQTVRCYNSCFFILTDERNCFKYNDVNNQQVATTFSFLNLFNSALHVSGDKFAHSQERFLTVYAAFGTRHRSAAMSVYWAKSCIHSQKLLLRIGEFVARNM